jgi:hypothetical protein
MARIFDNIEKQLLPALCETLKVSDRADSCVENWRGYLWQDRFASYPMDDEYPLRVAGVETSLGRDLKPRRQAGNT